MKTIAILNLKGGTAKTVTAATMARCFSAEHGKQVVLIDADQQGNLSQYFGITDTSQCGNTWTLLTDGAGYWPDFVTPAGPNLDLIPSGMELARADLPGSGARVTRIEELRTVLAEDGVQYLIIDLPPSLGLASQAALLAADEVIIPIRLDVFSTAGMAELTRQVDSMRSVNPRLRVAGILGTRSCICVSISIVPTWRICCLGACPWCWTICWPRPEAAGIGSGPTAGAFPVSVKFNGRRPARPRCWD